MHHCNSRFMSAIRWLTLLPLLWLAGCSLSPQPDNDNLVELAPGVRITLPSPAEYGGSLSASQLIRISWQQEGKAQTRTLPVQLQITPQKLALAGFSSWGSRILSLTYENGQITTAVLPGLGDTLPKPEQVALNLMLTLWPISAWDKALAGTGWQLQQQGLSRQLLSPEGLPMIRIDYSAADKLAGPISFRDNALGLTITITTLSQGADHDSSQSH
ncbi:DUF3261 domain-containing protein [Shewanella sp. GXUN23E]|uniref:DUF3261 domain-containing protein n=1 Tax=Shewanella sp. GXUN23E TaxID=3422498 RepID=UPI003D7D4D23